LLRGGIMRKFVTLRLGFVFLLIGCLAQSASAQSWSESKLARAKTLFLQPTKP